MEAVLQNEIAPPAVSVLIAGWNGIEGRTPFDAKLTAYGCTLVHMPHENVAHVPKCDIAILGLRSSNHSTTEKVRTAYRAFNRPVIAAPAGFEPIRARFEEVLEEVRKAKAPKVVVRKNGGGISEANALSAEERIVRREEEKVVLNTVKIDPAPTVESIVRVGYVNRRSPADIAEELNRRGFKTPRGKAFKENTISVLATRFGCARKGKGKAGATPQVSRDELIGAILGSQMALATKLSYIERVHRGELTSLIDSGAKGDDSQIMLWRVSLTDPEHGVRMKMSKAEACLVIEHLDAVRALAEAE